MIKFWIITICVFLIITFVLNKVINKHFLGDKKKHQGRWNIYHWEGLVAISSGLTFVVLFVLKSTNMLSI